jgi:polyhydroxybutyrate depolymerase
MGKRRVRVRLGIVAGLVVAAVALGVGLDRGAARVTKHDSATEGSATGAVSRTISFGGSRRRYWFYRPASASESRRVPLEVVLPAHGYTTKLAENYVPVADAGGFLLAFPETESEWNDPSDQNFVAAVIDAVVAQDQADPQRVFAAGGSAGGFAAYTLACGVAADRLAGVGVVFGAFTTRRLGSGAIDEVCPASSPLSVIAVHGTKDGFVPYDGQACKIGKETGKPFCLPSQAETMAYWTKRDACTARAESQTDGAVATQLWRPCRAGSAVELVTVKGGGHTVGSLTVGGVTPQERIWRFFRDVGFSKATSLEANVPLVKVIRAAGGRRLIARVTVNTPASGRLLLRRAAKTLASSTSKLSEGTTTVVLRVPRRVAAGRYVLQLVVTAPNGQTAALSRAVRLPPPIGG